MSVSMSFNFSDQIFLNTDTHVVDSLERTCQYSQHLGYPLPGIPHRYFLVPEHPGGAMWLRQAHEAQGKIMCTFPPGLAPDVSCGVLREQLPLLTLGRPSATWQPDAEGEGPSASVSNNHMLPRLPPTHTRPWCEGEISFYCLKWLLRDLSLPVSVNYN